MLLNLYIILSVIVAGNHATQIYNELQLQKATAITGFFQFVVFFWVAFFVWPILFLLKK